MQVQATLDLKNSELIYITQSALLLLLAITKKDPCRGVDKFSNPGGWGGKQ